MAKNKKKRKEPWWKSNVVLAWIPIVLTLIGFFITKYQMDQSSKAMNLNYHLTCESPATMGNNDIDYTLGPFVFELHRGKLSGEFKSLYVATVKDEKLDMVEMNSSNYNNFSYEFGDTMKLFNASDNSKSLVTMKYFIMPPISDNDFERYGIFHMILKGYNNDYEYFTIIYYFTKPDFSNIRANEFYTSKITTYILKNDDIYEQSNISKIAYELTKNANKTILEEELFNVLEGNIKLIKEKLQGV